MAVTHFYLKFKRKNRIKTILEEPVFIKKKWLLIWSQ